MKKLIIVVLVLIIGWFAWNIFSKDGETPYWEKPANNETKKTNSSSNSQTDNDSDSADSDEQPESTENVWYGRLEKSSSPSRGNLQLMMDDEDRIVYITTSRDFSALIGKDVKVTVEGTFSDFTLINIEPQ
jgi:hypothetical protein